LKAKNLPERKLEKLWFEKKIFVILKSMNVNCKEKKLTTIPRHREIDENLAKKICKDLGIPKP